MTTKSDLKPVTLGDWCVWTLVRLFVAYWTLFAILAGAAVAALFARYIDFALALGEGAVRPRLAQHIGWVVGAIVCTIGTIFGWYRVTIGKDTSGSAFPDEPAPVPRDFTFGYAIRAGLVMAPFGVLFGIIVGATLAFCWVSLAVSPWGPAEWSDSIQFFVTGFKTQHPLAIGAFLAPMGGFGLLGFFLGFVGGPLGWVNVSWGRDS